MNLTYEEIKKYCKENEIWVHVNDADEYNEVIRLIVKCSLPDTGYMEPPYNAKWQYIGLDRIPMIGYADEYCLAKSEEDGMTAQIVEWEDFKEQFNITDEDLAVTVTIDETNVYRFVCILDIREKVKVVTEYFQRQGFQIDNQTPYKDTDDGEESA